ncbi:MAG: hypothetical protein ACRDKY_05270 [Solirubrobacteraceae bacterium]
MIVACVALFVGMSGAGYAASKIGANQIKNNAVRSKHIKNGQVKRQDLRVNAVNGDKVEDSSLRGADLANGSVSGEDVADGGLAGADVADGGLTGADVADRSIGGADLAPNSVDDSKVADDSLKGADIDESTLGQVPDAATVGGKAPSAFIASDIYKAESAIGPGTALGDGTFSIQQACNPGDIMLSGGPANVASTSTLLESFPAPGTTNAWKARISKNAQADNFSVVVLCANQ